MLKRLLDWKAEPSVKDKVWTTLYNYDIFLTDCRMGPHYYILPVPPGI